MRWSVEIQKTSLERRNLSDLLEGIGYELVDGIDYPAMASPVFEEMNSRQDVWFAARELRDALTGPAAIDTGFALGSVVDYSSEPPTRHAFLEVAHCQMKMSSTSATLSVAPPLGMSAVELVAWEKEQAEIEYQRKLKGQLVMLEAVVKEPNAVKVLELMSLDEHNGESLNKIYELMAGDPSGRTEFLARFGITYEEYLRFSDAVHNPAVSGDKARHAYDQIPKSANPMSLREAEGFVRRLTKDWMAWVRTR